MSSIIGTLRRASEFLASSRAAVDTGGDNNPTPGVLANAIDDLDGLVRAGTSVSPADLPAYLDAIRNLNGVGLDDRQFLLEKLLTVMSRLPADSDMSRKMQHFFIDALYKDLPHPPAAFLSPVTGAPDTLYVPEFPYAHRTHDGANYNPQFPTLGQAGQPYARTVPSTSLTPPAALPDPGLVFDLLLKRTPRAARAAPGARAGSAPPEAFEAHPGGLNALFFATANLVIHSIFDTNRTDCRVNDTSSFIDLSPLYGNSVSRMKRPTEKLRVLDGTGRIWDDCFADARLLFMPPATAALLVLLSRNHNYTAEKILAINERGLYANPPPTDEKARRAQDDAIFHRARLVNCGFFAKIVLYDYVGGILGMTRDGSPFRLNLVESMRESDHAFAPTGEGNQISCEFNLLYRWHASTSATDAKWIDGVFQKLLGGKPYNTVTPDDFKKAAGRFMRPDEDLRKWTFGGLQRDATTGRFRDEELAAILMDATEAPAHAFGARRTPEALRVVEIMTIEQGREWGVCTLNEFRKFFGLKPYANFREWNPDPEIYNAAQALYRDIDNLELHVGMQAEDTKPPMSGAGLCPSYTMSRAILADAVVLCRSDPYLTTEFTPYNVTSWGYQDCVVNPKDGSHGGMLTKLMFRHLEGQFNSGDAYAHFPLLVPSAMRAAMEKRGDPAIKKYSWARPKTAGALVTTSSKDGVRAVLDRPDLFVSGYNDRVRALVKGMVIDRHLVQDAMVRDMVKYRWEDDFAQITGELIRAGSIARPGFGASQIDIVQDVINLVPVYFLAHDILGLPLKTAANPGGVYRPAKLYDLFANVGNYVLFHKNSEEEWASRERAAHCADMVIGEIGSNLERLSYGIFSVGGLIDTITDYFSSTTDRSGQFLTGLLADAKRERLSHAELAACLFAEVVPSAAQFASAIAHIVDFYLDDQQATARAGLVSIAAARGVEPNANEKLLSYAKNALRANPPVSATYRVARANAVVDGKQVKAGQRVLANISTGSADQFGDGSEMYTFGAEGLLNAKFFDRMAPAVLRVIFGLRNVRRAPGLSGQVPKFVQDLEGTPQVLYIGKDSGVSPWPTRLMVQYDS